MGANHREADRAESHDYFIQEMGVMEKAASETCYWLDLCKEAGMGDAKERQWLLKESSELPAIFTSIGGAAKPRCRKWRLWGRCGCSNTPQIAFRDPQSTEL